MFTTLKPSSKHSIDILALPLLVSWICFAVHEQMPPPHNKETVFATPLQSRFSFHSCRGLDAGDMLTLPQQRRTRFTGGTAWAGLDGTSFHWWHKCTRGSGKAVEASESISCWGRRQIKFADLGQSARKGKSQVFEDDGYHGGKCCKGKQRNYWDANSW